MSLQIDYTVNKWLKTISIEDNTDYLNKVLNLGFQVTNTAQISFNPESTILDPLNQKMHDINESCTNTYEDILTQAELFKKNTDVIADKMTSLDKNVSRTLDKQYEDAKIQYTQLTSAIYKLTGESSTSSIKGKIGENYLENILKDSFPDDTISVT